MPWKECSPVSERLELVELAQRGVGDFALLCRRFGVSRKTGYKWLARFAREGPSGLEDRSRRPRTSPWRCSDEQEAAVLAVRTAHPAWGGRKIRHYLLHAGRGDVPAPSTITAILHRHGRIDPERSREPLAYQRFEYPAPNELWQMDFKGDVGLRDKTRCHPLTVLDDHSRYAVCVQACLNQRRETVRTALQGTFERYGLPAAMLMDNGSCWGYDADHRFTRLGVWLIRLGIRVMHGAPYHPQTQGKNERFNRTLKAEVLAGASFYDLACCQVSFDAWRALYNSQRPHDSLGGDVPASRYQPSARAYRSVLEPIEYPSVHIVRKVHSDGSIKYRGETYRVGTAFHRQPVAIAPTHHEGVIDVYYCRQRIARIDLQARRLPPGGDAVQDRKET
jgi:transposase InsO family protein